MDDKKHNIINERVNYYIETIKKNFHSKINIYTNTLNDESETCIDYGKAKQSVLWKKAITLVDKLKTRKFINNNEIIYVSNSDVKKSISETLKNQEQNKYKVENLAVFIKLNEIIENAIEIGYAENDNKGRNYKQYKYYVSNVYIDKIPFIVEFDTRLQQGESRNIERHFRLERVYPVIKIKK